MSSSAQAKSSKKPWTTQEDSLLLKLIEEHGSFGSWPKIAQKMETRTGKQCRERFINQLDPNIKRTPWSAEEDAIILDLHDKLGNKWCKFMDQLPGRSDNAIKNRWHVISKENGAENGKANVLYQNYQTLPQKNISAPASSNGLGANISVSQVRPVGHPSQGPSIMHLSDLKKLSSNSENDFDGCDSFRSSQTDVPMFDLFDLDMYGNLDIGEVDLPYPTPGSSIKRTPTSAELDLRRRERASEEHTAAVPVVSVGQVSPVLSLQSSSEVSPRTSTSGDSNPGVNRTTVSTGLDHALTHCDSMFEEMILHDLMEVTPGSTPLPAREHVTNFAPQQTQQAIPQMMATPQLTEAQLQSVPTMVPLMPGLQHHNVHPAMPFNPFTARALPGLPVPGMLNFTGVAFEYIVAPPAVISNGVTTTCSSTTNSSTASSSKSSPTNKRNLTVQTNLTLQTNNSLYDFDYNIVAQESDLKRVAPAEAFNDGYGLEGGGEVISSTKVDTGGQDSTEEESGEKCWEFNANEDLNSSLDPLDVIESSFNSPFGSSSNIPLPPSSHSKTGGPTQGSLPPLSKVNVPVINSNGGFTSPNGSAPRIRPFSGNAASAATMLGWNAGSSGSSGIGYKYYAEQGEQQGQGQFQPMQQSAPQMQLPSQQQAPFGFGGPQFQQYQFNAGMGSRAPVVFTQQQPLNLQQPQGGSRLTVEHSPLSHTHFSPSCSNAKRQCHFF